MFVVLFLIMGLGGGILREYAKRQWDGIGRLTMITVEESEVLIESVDPVTREAIRIKLPPELQVQTLEGKGVWRVGVLHELAEKHGNKWAGDSIANFLGIAYTGLTQEMNLWDKVNWAWRSRDLDWNEVPLKETTLLAETTEVDDQKVLGLDSRWSKKARQYFAAADLSTEGYEVSITNSTDTSGLGATAARVVDSSGMRVIMVRSDPTHTVEECIVEGNKEAGLSSSGKFLVRSFGCKFVEDEGVREGELDIVLGTKYRERLYGKKN